MGTIGVVGSINTDIVCKTDVVPVKGQTVVGEDYFIAQGGKGANVAVACARQNQNVSLIGCVGDDLFSQNMLTNLNNEGINTSTITQLKGERGGFASITLSDGDNRIIVVPGANRLITPQMVETFKKDILKCDIVGGQFEIPVESLFSACKICYENNIKFVLNLSPIKEYPKDFIKMSTFIVVNEIEVKEIEGYDELNPDKILQLYPNKLIVTKGGNGVEYCNGKEIVRIPALNIDVVDTTGAGDTFLGSFMVGTANGLNITDAIYYANICAGLKTTKIGAQTGMPTLDEVKQYIKEHNINLEINF